MDLSLSPRPECDLQAFLSNHADQSNQATVLDLSFSMLPENESGMDSLLSSIAKLPNIKSILLSPDQKWNTSLRERIEKKHEWPNN